MNNTESDSSTDINFDIFNDLELQYFSEPYNILGQFILSTVVGLITSHILNKQELNKIIDLYFKYCKNIENDNYIDDLIKKINLENNLDKIEKVLNESKKLTIKIINKLVNNNYKDLELEQLNIKLIGDTIRLIKYNDIILLLC
jgi:hypothetical protein